jgi:hypothetical protein
VTPCSDVVGYRRFGGPRCLQVLLPHESIGTAITLHNFNVRSFVRSFFEFLSFYLSSRTFLDV